MKVTVKPGTIIHLAGLPFELVNEAVIEGHPSNIEQVRMAKLCDDLTTALDRHSAAASQGSAKENK